MKSVNRRNWMIIGVVALLAIVALYQTIVSATEEGTWPGNRAPSFELKALDGNVYSVGGKRDNPLLLNFWASWCGPCHLEAPDLEEMHQKYRGKLDIYGVNVTSLDSRESAQKFVDDYRLTFPIPLDTDGEAAGRIYKLNGYPTSFLIDQNGVIVKGIFGPVDVEELEATIERMIAKH